MNLLKWVKLQNAQRLILLSQSPFTLQEKMSYNLLSNKNTADFIPSAN